MNRATLVSPYADFPLTTTLAVSGDAAFLDGWNSEKDRQSSYTGFGKQSVLEALVDKYDACKNEDWDGRGAQPVTLAAYRNGYSLVESLPPSRILPSVGAEPDGYLTLEWYKNPSRLLSVSIGTDGDLHYAALLGSAQTAQGSVPFSGEVPKEVIALIRRIDA